MKSHAKYDEFIGEVEMWSNRFKLNSHATLFFRWVAIETIYWTIFVCVRLQLVCFCVWKNLYYYNMLTDRGLNINNWIVDFLHQKPNNEWLSLISSKISRTKQQDEQMHLNWDSFHRLITLNIQFSLYFELYGKRHLYLTRLFHVQ